MKDDVAIVIPAYNPDNKLKMLIDELITNSYLKIIVINDGSRQDEVFDEIDNLVIKLFHEKNRGKGIALKTGFEYCLNSFEDILGVITVDADGQHTIDDINKVYEEFKLNSNNFILGSRNFEDKKVPYRSRFGNILVRNLLKIKTGVCLSDTQTGLRAIPQKYLEFVKNVKGERFEYEMNVILDCIKYDAKFREVHISTTYIENNKSSNYKVLKDSFKICNSINRFNKNVH